MRGLPENEPLVSHFATNTDTIRLLTSARTDGGEEALGELGGHRSALQGLSDVDENAISGRHSLNPGRDSDRLCESSLNIISLRYSNRITILTNNFILFYGKRALLQSNHSMVDYCDTSVIIHCCQDIRSPLITVLLSSSSLPTQHLTLENVVGAAEGPADLVAVDLLEQPDLLAVREAVAATQHGVHEGQVGAVEPGVGLRARLPGLGLVSGRDVFRTGLFESVIPIFHDFNYS